MFYQDIGHSGWRRTASRSGFSLALHILLLAGLALLRFPAKPVAPHFAATPLYFPATEPASPAVARPVKQILARPLTAPPKQALLAKLPAVRPLNQEPPSPSIPVPPRLTALPILPAETPPPPVAPAAPVRNAGFESVAVAAPPAAPMLPRPARTGAFATAGTSVPVTRLHSAASSGSFSTTEVTNHQSRTSGPISAAGFGAASTATRDVARDPAARAAGRFETAVAAAPGTRPEAVVAGHFDQPVEILDKPRPAYTEAGRQAKVEGEVVLEVLFGASGHLRVMRILHGLGYGLEQSAVHAAERIRFRPATEHGRAVDTIAMVTVAFQLAY